MTGQQTVFERVFKNPNIADANTISNFDAAFKNLRTEKEIKAIIKLMELISASRGKPSNLTVNSSANGDFIIEDKQFHKI